MTAAARRARERAALRARILEAARALFLREGVEAVTMRRIAEAIEYTPPVLYRHFRDKADLLHALCAEDAARFLAGLERAARTADPLERIRRMGRAYVGFALTEPHLYRLLFMTPIPEAELVEVGRRQRPEDPGQRAYALLRGAVEEAVALGRFDPAQRDVERLTQALWAAAHGLVSLWILYGASPALSWRAPRPTAHLLLDAALAGLSARARGGVGP